jgi:hypothetical protein
MAKTRVDRLPVELFDLADQRSKAIGQSRSQAYRDITQIAQRMPGIIQTPIPSIKEIEKPKPHGKKKRDIFDFRI